MAQLATDGEGGNRSGDRRTDDRRTRDRRKSDRRTPPPPWRRPWAYVAYGVVAALALVLVLSWGEDEDPAAAVIATTRARPGVQQSTGPAADAPPRNAAGAAGYAQLIADGDAAAGRRVLTHLYCEEMAPVSVRLQATTHPSVAELADAAGRVPAAECRWGAGTTAPEVLLLVPADVAGEFAGTPHVEEGFITRRSVQAELEWIGRSEALALRNVGVLRDVR